MKRNPFKPGAGHTPPVLVGRDRDIADFTDGLDSGPGGKFRLIRVTGARGMGKTVLLTAFTHIAENRGWAVVRESASQGLLPRLLIKLQSDYIREPHSLSCDPAAFADAMRGKLLEVEAQGNGLLIEIDEVQAADKDEMAVISNAVRVMHCERRNYALVFAGLPSMSAKWLDDESVTFLRDAKTHWLDDIPLPDVSGAFSKTFHDSGMMLSDMPLRMATEATYGYPYMIQLVGYYIWSAAQHAHPDIPEVDETDAKTGITKALSRLYGTVHEPELQFLPAIDKAYLLAMAQDDGPSSTSTIAARMGGNASADLSRKRLLAGQVIKDFGSDRLDFVIPYMREYLRENETHIRMISEPLG